MERTEFRLHGGDFILLADGARAVLLVNRGDALRPELQAETTMTHDHGRTAELGTDRPGHFDKGSRTMRGSFAMPDLHEDAEDQFARTVADMLEERLGREASPRLVVASPPRMLGRLRAHFSPRVSAMVVAEIDRDLTHVPTAQVADLISRP
ncbi:hypothetical protein DLJ53_04910 [Acuticoccus sediminis]|uniref:Protein required for attachment to host cells n=1 Tax=Acuticoccus sediminis TaxID=2184697 RepID=A0A8B2P025_9HYPH|nr:host attachment protein [Acuticoccus sediminis]RAI03815.1 hypothetical protein DLJ53_04910 [Acuticoccus sediminis]